MGSTIVKKEGAEKVYDKAVLLDVVKWYSGSGVSDWAPSEG